jgi:OFA family oxalate/formate antiporter-like MFS transporter
MLLISLSLVSGAGIGFGYVCPLSVGMKWFPKKKGLVTGTAVAGFGGGAVILSSIAQHFLSNGMTALDFFNRYALVTGVVLLIAASILADPAPRKKLVKHEKGDELFSTPFLIITLGMFSGTFAGLLIIGNLTSFVIEAGLSAKLAVTAVAVFSIGNAIGRVAWGQIFDYLNYKSIPISLAAFAIFSVCILFSLPEWLLLLKVGLLGFCFGSNFVIYASSVSNIFGEESFPKLYPICFLAYGLAGSVGPGIGGYLADATGSYRLAIYLSVGLVVLTSFLATKYLYTFKEAELENNDTDDDTDEAWNPVLS